MGSRNTRRHWRHCHLRHRPGVRDALQAFDPRRGLCPHRPRRPESRARRRLPRAADFPFHGRGQPEDAAAGSRPRRPGFADHQGPHARRHRRRILRPRQTRHLLDRAGRADARQPHQRRRRTARTDRGEIRRRPALGRRHHEPRGAAGAARDLRQIGAGRGRRRHPEQRPRARIGIADQARPERHQALQSDQFLRRAWSDHADQDHQGARAGAQPDRPHHRGQYRATGPGGAADDADDREHQARGRTGAAARHRQQDRRDARARPRRSNRPRCRTRPNTASSRNWRSPTSRPRPTRPATPERSKPISR